jgi:hypothetical protein
VKHTRVKDLTVSERQRLNVSCHLLLDADIVRFLYVVVVDDDDIATVLLLPIYYKCCC